MFAKLRACREASFTMAMVAQYFLSQRIAPLQRHQEPMLRYAGAEDRMRLVAEAMSFSLAFRVMDSMVQKPRVPFLPASALPSSSMMEGGAEDEVAALEEMGQSWGGS